MTIKYVNSKQFNFVQTCEACPEQYDVFLDGDLVGYVRLRWGELYCTYPNVMGKQVYTYSMGDGITGAFRTDDERNFHLEEIAKSLYNVIFR